VVSNSQELLVVFWDEGSVDFAGSGGPGTSIFRADAQPLGAVRVSNLSISANVLFYTTLSLTGLPGGGIEVPPASTGVVVQLAWINGGCTPTQYQDLAGCVYNGGCGGSADRRILGTLLTEQSQPGSAGGSSSYAADLISSGACAHLGQLIGPAETVSVGAATVVPQIYLVGRIPTCGTADINNDDIPGTNQDIEAFFACLGGHCCATCQTADFNSDGDFGTDQDIEAFFRVLAGGAC
jgi:hypothetical protein